MLIYTRRPSLKLRHPREMGDTASPVTPPIPQIRPKERLAAISANVDQELQRYKERDRNWEDSIDVSVLATVVTLSMLDLSVA